MVSEVTYNWKIDFAIILAAISFLFTLGKLIFENRAKKKKSRIEVYEKVFDDTIFILLHPLKYKKELASQKKFTDPDPEFESAVRNYLNSHILSRLSSNLDKYVPSSITNQRDKLKYLIRVTEAAMKFRSEVSYEQFALNIPNMSPVNYFDNEEINMKFQNIVQVVGKNLSLFSKDVQYHWSDILTKNPNEVKIEYQKGLEVCSEYFVHNRRDFKDPFYDLLIQIRDDYRKMTRKKIDTIIDIIRYYGFRIKHPIQGYRIYKENKKLLSQHNQHLSPTSSSNRS
jgi:hypothetical protein